MDQKIGKKIKEKVKGCVFGIKYRNTELFLMLKIVAHLVTTLSTMQCITTECYLSCFLVCTFLLSIKNSLPQLYERVYF